MYDIYYAHHRWKYGTEIEKYELELIKRYFPNGRICNPATDLNFDGLSEEEAMETCLDAVRNSDILVFSAVDGFIGVGVSKEVNMAEGYGKIVFYIDQDIISTTYSIYTNESEFANDRVYAFVYRH